MKNLLSPRAKVSQKGYNAQRMDKERFSVEHWMREYETAHTKAHREVCRKMINMHLKRHEYYANR